MRARSNGSWSATPTRATAGRPVTAPAGRARQPDPADHQHGRDARCAVSSTARCTTSPRRTWSTAARWMSRASPAISFPIRPPRAPLLRQDRTVPDQSHGGGAPRAPREPSLDRAQPLLRLRRRKEEIARYGRSYLQWYFESGLLDAGVKRTLAENDPLAYGFKAARPVLATIAQYVHEQGLSARLVGLDEIFAPSTLDV